MFAEFGFTIPFQILMLFIPIGKHTVIENKIGQELYYLFCHAGSAVGYTASVFIAKKLKKKNQFIMAACIMMLSAGYIKKFMATCIMLLSTT